MQKILLGSALALAFSAGIASAATFVLDFEGLQNLEAVNDFYNGGTGGNGSSGTNYGVSFSPTSLAIIDSDAGGTGNIANEPTPDTVLFFVSGGAATMNVAAGFDTGFSFFYAAANLAGFINVYDGLDGTGNILASLALPSNGSGGGGDPNGNYNVWDAVGVVFAGTAMSVDFGGTADQIAFDNVTFGSDIPDPGKVPIPAALPLLAGALAAFGLIRRRS
jgi:hypothetical protein